MLAANFNIKNAKSFLIMTDWEPDDAMFVVGFLREVSFQFRENFPPIAFISGGANAAIQNARAQKYIALCQEEGWLPSTIKIEFFQGANSSQHYHKQGADVLSPEELKSFTTSNPNFSPEIDKIKLFLEQNPHSMVFALKRPDEMVGNLSLLPLLSKAVLVAYAGGYNIGVENKEDLKQFYDAFSAAGFVQNFIMLQNGGDGTPRDITKENTPYFAKSLEMANTPTARAIIANIRLWNEKILFEFACKARDSDASLMVAEKAQKHQAGCKLLKDILPAKVEDFTMNPEILASILAAVELIDESAKLANAKSDKDKIGFRKGVLIAIAKEPNHQVVIADHLALYAVMYPEKMTGNIIGEVDTTSFIKVNSSENGRCLNFGPIEGTPGKQGTRITAIDHFLCKTVLGTIPVPSDALVSNPGITLFHSGSTTTQLSHESKQEVQVSTPINRLETEKSLSCS